jgi:hypothetical protein
MGRNRTRLERVIAIGCESTFKGASSLPSDGLLAAWMQSRVNSLFVIPYSDDATCGACQLNLSPPRANRFRIGDILVRP